MDFFKIFKKSKSYYRMGGVQLLLQGIRTKLKTLPEIDVNDDVMNISYNDSIYSVSTEYPSPERWRKYERGVMGPGPKAVINDTLDPGDTFIDIGAQCGDTALYVHSIVGHTGDIHAFEPTTYWYDIFKENIRRNQVENIVANNAAVGDQTGDVPPQDVVGGENDLMDDTFQRDRVPTVSLDEYVEESEIKPDLIQIDVDGADFDVLSGGRDVIKSTPTILELHHEGILDEWNQAAEFIFQNCRVFYLDVQGYVPPEHQFKTEIHAPEELDSNEVSYILLK
jgi:FkbM family methyltransferase